MKGERNVKIYIKNIVFDPKVEEHNNAQLK
jgi:hypothetical protein